VVHHGSGEGELYDLEHDPGEHENLWERDPGLRERMVRACFDHSVVATPDPLPSRLADW
jgi:hypothetical protein